MGGCESRSSSDGNGEAFRQLLYSTGHFSITI